MRKEHHPWCNNFHLSSINCKMCEKMYKKYPYVSRAAFKLKKAIEDFSIDIKGLKILDIGISTGGFTDYLLKNGADSVVGVDVNINQVDYQLRKHERLKLLKKNARYLQRNDIHFEPDLITIDVSFISVEKEMRPFLMLRRTISSRPGSYIVTRPFFSDSTFFLSLSTQ